MVSRDALAAVALGLVLLAGSYFLGCSQERRRQVRDGAALVAGSDSVITRLRNDSASQAAARARIAQDASTAQAQADSLARRLDGLNGRVGAWRNRSDSLALALSAAQTPRDSLDRSVAVIGALRLERDSLTGVVGRLGEALRAQVLATVTLKVLQVADSTHADQAERKAAAFALQSEGWKSQLLAERRSFSLRMKLGGGVVLAGVGVLCLASTVC